MLSVLKKFNRLFDAHQKKRAFLLLFLMIIGAFLEVLGVSMILPLLTIMMKQSLMETNPVIRLICTFLHISTHERFVAICVAILIIIFICKNLFLIFQTYMQGRFIFHTRFEIQSRMLHAFMLRPYEYYLNAQSGEIMRIISGDVSQSFTLLTTVLNFVSESIVSLALVGTVFFIEPTMTLFIAATMGLTMLVITKFVKPMMRRAGLSYQENAVMTNKWLLEAITGIKDVKVSHKESFFEENYNFSGKKQIQAEHRSFVWNAIPRLLIEMVSVCTILAYIAIKIINGAQIESMIPSIGALGMAAVKLLPSANRIMTSLNAVAYHEPALDKTIENLQALTTEAIPVDNKLTSDDIELLTVNDAVVLENISYSYPNSDKMVLNHANMNIPVGKSVGIVGTSGAGKTTAVDILLGLLTPQEGQIFADGKDVMKNYAQWLTHLSYIPQSIFMLDDTIRANVAFGLNTDQQDDKKVWHALEEAQLADFVKSLPDGLDTTIGERGVRLSGGQRQRIGIARALYSNPELLIFDEATSALDNETEAAIMESINSLHGKKTLIIIAHRLQTIEGCDIVYRVVDGKIVRER